MYCTAANTSYSDIFSFVAGETIPMNINHSYATATSSTATLPTTFQQGNQQPAKTQDTAMDPEPDSTYVAII